MPLQLHLFDGEEHITRFSIWSELPTTAQREVQELLADLLLAAVQPTPLSAKECSDEPSESHIDPSGP